mmetsp:Transcript_14366/g.42750  ORF Transcript_14366/g.42750 Transcript_14366/m.42750 type:complete len:330 (+) Transcript_14366:953-1942(+)
MARLRPAGRPQLMGRVARALARRLPQAADARARHAQPPGPHHAGRPLLRRLHRAALVRVWVRHPQPAPRPSDRVLGVGARPIHLLLLALRLARHAASRRRQPVAARAAALGAARRPHRHVRQHDVVVRLLLEGRRGPFGLLRRRRALGHLRGRRPHAHRDQHVRDGHHRHRDHHGLRPALGAAAGARSRPPVAHQEGHHAARRLWVSRARLLGGHHALPLRRPPLSAAHRRLPYQPALQPRLRGGGRRHLQASRPPHVAHLVCAHDHRHPLDTLLPPLRARHAARLRHAEAAAAAARADARAVAGRGRGHAARMRHRRDVLQPAAASTP